MYHTRLRTIAFLATTLPWLVPGSARADAIAIQLATSVHLGQQPRLTITANQTIDQVEVSLDRDDGKHVEETFGPLAVGASHDVLFDATPGKRHYRGRIMCAAGKRSWSSQVSFDTVVADVLRVSLDRSHVDLAHGHLDVMVSIPAGKIELKIVSAADGAPLLDRTQTFADHDSNAPLSVRWEPPSKDGSGKPVEIGRIDVRVVDPAGAFHLTSLYPWSITIPHQEVHFATDSAAIAPGEAPKLQASLAKIGEVLAKHLDFGPIKLFIVGHTDTVGSAKHNLELSLRRAQAIAGWFRKSGLTLPILYEGFGEQALLVATPDNTDEPRNRRVDYILSVEDPVLPASDFRPSWKSLE